MSVQQVHLVRNLYPSSGADLEYDLLSVAASNLHQITFETETKAERLVRIISEFDESFAREASSDHPIAREILTKEHMIEYTGTYLDQLEQYPIASINGEIEIRVPNIDPDVLFGLADNEKLESCFFEILYQLEEVLLRDSRAESLSVSRLRDPEGEELRIYFEVRTSELPYHERRSIRNNLEKLVDRIVEDTVADDLFVSFRVIFGIAVVQE